jgi:hypothetical protein
MIKDNCWLSKHAGNVTSQKGEDGIIVRALEVIGNNDRWCVEFGAWDGKECSNTYNLIVNKGYSSVLIEANSDRYGKLVETFQGNGKVIAVNAMVGFEAGNNLDVLLAKTPIPTDFDFLSIDIDGNDYHVWEAVVRYRPKLLAIEYNPTIPNAVEFVQPRDMSLSQGSSLSAIVNLCKGKGYKLIAVTDLNGIFVDDRYFPLFGISDNSIDVLRLSSSDVTYIFSGYDGTVFLSGCRKLVWHDVEYDPRRVQQLPFWLRKYPPSLGRIRLACLRFMRKIRASISHRA